jgi:2-hydroxychromene-2-carboxylate isomerase
MWEHGIDVSKPELLAGVLGKRFGEGEARVILQQANNAEYKGNLNANTKEALDRGAFGCPWYWVRNGKGDEEPFFGSDRYACFSLSACNDGSGKVADSRDVRGNGPMRDETSVPKY